jgi:tRNA threonylcarbamoyladenosine biosynthesis protein TsaE
VSAAPAAAGEPLRALTESAAGTKELAGRLAPLVRAGDVVLLVGDLGAGKTVFAQGFAAALGVRGPVTSPTFALVRHYRTGEGAPVATVIHADVYRTDSVEEVADLALAELVEEDAVAVVEWGDVAAPALGESALVVTLEAPDTRGAPERRAVTVELRGSWSERSAAVAGALAPCASPLPSVSRGTG